MTETSLDKMMPETEADFAQFAEALKSRITFFEVKVFSSVVHNGVCVCVCVCMWRGCEIYLSLF